MKKFALGCGGIVVLLLLVVGMGGCRSYNGLVRLSQDTDAKWAQVQNQYQRRNDLIDNLVKTVAGAANCGVLVTLYMSNWNSLSSRSVSLVCLRTEKSNSRKPAPRNMFLPMLPNVPCAGGRMTEFPDR